MVKFHINLFKKRHIMRNILIILFFLLFIAGIFGGISCDDTNTSSDSVTNIVMYGTNALYDRDLSGRSGADLRCKSDINAPTDRSNFRAFISVSTTDDIASMPTNYNFSSTLPIVTTDETEVGTNWADLLDGSNTVSLEDLGIFMHGKSFNYYWHGSNTDGTESTDNTALGWTSAYNSAIAGIGYDPILESSYTSTSPEIEEILAHLICIAY
jgi:hypothetical protein